MTRRSALAAGFGFRAALARLARAGPENSDHATKVRFVSSMSVIGDVNPNDANAAILNWRNELERLGHLDLNFDAPAIVPFEKLFQLVREAAVDGFAATTPEYLRMAPFVDPGIVLVDDAYTDGGEEYLLLVHDKSPIKSLADLRGADLQLFSAPAASIAPVWLDTVLDAANLVAPARFFSQISPASKLSKAILPVYFRRSAACLVTRRGLSTMAEMNPDVGRQLRTLCSSPRFIPDCMAFHKDCPPACKTEFLAAISRLPKVPEGKQLLAMFQSHGVFFTEQKILSTVKDLVRSAERIRARRERQGD